jgi:2-beta-glucuronyltransferase
MAMTLGNGLTIDRLNASPSLCDAVPSSTLQGRVLLISDHDYRTARRANMHPIADALARLGCEVCFVSVRFSPLSRLKGDSRTFLWDRANRPEMQNGVQCYLWKTPFHPFHPHMPIINDVATLAYRAYAHWPNQFLDEAMRTASFIVVESGLGALLMQRARDRNPSATIVYVASDELATVGVHPFVQAQLEAAIDDIDQVCVPSPRMAPRFEWARDRLFYVPHGLDAADFPDDEPTPYAMPRNAVSVGSMLFDRTVFTHAAARLPDVQFHVIGAGEDFDAPENVHLHREMPFRDTVRFIRHADVGIAPYRAAPGCDYLCDTSMKLMQYEYFGVPAVCPTFAAGERDDRFGYLPGEPASIEAAMRAALDKGRTTTPKSFLTWEDVVRRLVDPRAFPDTVLGT